MSKEKKEKKSCSNCRHKNVCLVTDKLSFNLHDDGHLYAALDFVLAINKDDDGFVFITDNDKTEMKEEALRDLLYQEVEESLRRVFGKHCGRYSREPEDLSKYTAEYVKGRLDESGFRIPVGVIEQWTRKARAEVCIYLIYYDNGDYKPDAVERIPPVLEPYLGLGANEADPEKFDSHKPSGGPGWSACKGEGDRDHD